MIKMTMKHYYYFGGAHKRLGNSLKDNSDGWDLLRLSDDKSIQAFSIPSERKLWEEKCMNNQELKLHAEKILNLLGSGYHRINSFGVGAACLEYFIKKGSNVYLSCSDFTADSLDRLRKVFTEADEIKNFNILEGDWENNGSDSVYLFYRMDVVFSDDEWREVFISMKNSGIQNILIVSAGFLTLKCFIVQSIKYFVYKLLKKEMIFDSYMRTESQAVELFDKFYKIERSGQIGKLKGILLKIRAEK